MYLESGEINDLQIFSLGVNFQKITKYVQL